MLEATFACPDLTTFCRLDDLGPEVVGQQLGADRAVLACRVPDPDRWCRQCGGAGVPRDRVTRRLAHTVRVAPDDAGGRAVPPPTGAPAADTSGAGT